MISLAGCNIVNLVFDMQYIDLYELHSGSMLRMDRSNRYERVGGERKSEHAVPWFEINFRPNETLLKDNKQPQNLYTQSDF